MKFLQKGLLHHFLVAHEALACEHLSTFEIYLMHFYPCWHTWHLWLKNWPTLCIKMMSFAYPHHEIYIQFPLITNFFHIFDMHDFKACQISTPVACETEVFGTDTCAVMWHSFQSVYGSGLRDPIAYSLLGGGVPYPEHRLNWSLDSVPMSRFLCFPSVMVWFLPFPPSKIQPGSLLSRTSCPYPLSFNP